MSWSYLLDFLIVALFGGAVGLGELVSRYWNEPHKVIETWPARIS